MLRSSPLSMLLCLFLASVYSPLVRGQHTDADSIWLMGKFPPVTDALPGQFQLGMNLDGKPQAPVDSMHWTTVHNAEIQLWAQSSLGRLQIEFPLSYRVDSLVFDFECDTTGCILSAAGDTLRSLWKFGDGGCFPAASERVVERTLTKVMQESFESVRFRKLAAALAGQCLLPEHIARCASLFDDEERRLKLVQSAPCTSPSRLPELTPLFATQFYRDQFLEWMESDQ